MSTNQGAGNWGLLVSLVSYLAVVLFVSCFTAPVAFVLLESHAFAGDSPWPYSRVFHRVALFWAIVGLIVFRKKLSLRSLAPALSIAASGGALRCLKVAAIGIVISLSASGLILLIFVLDDRFFLSFPPPARTAYLLGKSLVSGVVISVIEESFFRVLLFGLMIRSLGVGWAAICSSSVYALVHFIHPSKVWILPGPEPWHGFVYLLETIHLMGLEGFWFGFVGFFLVGVTLCTVYHKTSSVYLCIGLHSGWVILMKIQAYFMQVASGVELPAALGRRYFLLGEPLGWLSIILTLLLTLVLWHRLGIAVRSASKARSIS